jgi:adenosylmethionine-8-amino-7-oxononanoate aminotransferase
MKRKLPPTVKQLQKDALRFLWHPFTQMREWEQQPPLIINRGKGAFVYDVEGNAYLDGTSSIWVNLHGHRHPTIDKAIRHQLTQIAHSTFLGLSHPPGIQLAKALIQLAPSELKKVFLRRNLGKRSLSTWVPPIMAIRLGA